MTVELTVGSLFSGIGGIDLGLERAGMHVVWQSEIEPYCCRVLAKHWPHVPNLGDITRIDWSQVERPDVICGGYPCQPFSLAGARAGDQDRRHLWPHMFTAIRELRPRYALLENVPGHLSMGFGRVLGDLAEIGYDTQWDCIPASAVGAPHRRDRVFVIAYPERNGLRVEPVAVAGRSGTDVVGADGPQGDVADAASFSDSDKQIGSDTNRQPLGTVTGASGGTGVGDHAEGDRDTGRGAGVVGEDVADTESRGRRRQRIFAPARNGRTRSTRRSASHRRPWPAEPNIRRVAHGVPSRMDRLRGLGNAVVPQVAEHVGRCISNEAP